jgi:hypothetical protein
VAAAGGGEEEEEECTICLTEPRVRKGVGGRFCVRGLVGGMGVGEGGMGGGGA